MQNQSCTHVTFCAAVRRPTPEHNLQTSTCLSKLRKWKFHTVLFNVQEKKKKWEPPAPPPRVGRKQRKRDKGASLGTQLPVITPNAKCKLRLLKLERVKDWLLMEEEFVQTQEQLKPQEDRDEEDRTKVI